MEVRLIYIQGTKEPWLESAESLYLDKIKPYCKTSVLKIKSSRFERADEKIKLQSESEQILEHLAPSDFFILLDQTGKSPSSLEFSALLRAKWDSGVRTVTFVIGGAFGVSDSVKKRANLTISFSKMTLNHHVARLVLLEQIYRAMMIMKNKPYHNE